MKSGDLNIICLKERDRFAPILSQTLGLNIELTQEGLKSVSKSVNGSVWFQKTLQIKAKV